MSRPPALPLYEWGKCPCEGCSFGKWTAENEIVVYNTWKQHRRQVAKLAKGDHVTGMPGVFITFRPGVIHMDRDMPDHHLKRGDTILIYGDRPEGNAAAWYKGRYYEWFDVSFTTWPTGCTSSYCAATCTDVGEKQWWTKVKLSSGHIGWVNMQDSHFDGMILSSF